MRERSSKKPSSLAGSLLLAHPTLRDPNFHRSVVLMTVHGASGASGVVINRPTGKRLGEVQGQFALGPLASVPLFEGGPVETGQLTLASWRMGAHGIQLHWGIAPEKASLGQEPEAHLRGFLGYAGWSAGQLESELSQGAWVVSEAPIDLLESPCDSRLWTRILAEKGPQWRILADEPEEPGTN